MPALVCHSKEVSLDGAFSFTVPDDWLQSVNEEDWMTFTAPDEVTSVVQIPVDEFFEEEEDLEKVFMPAESLADLKLVTAPYLFGIAAIVNGLDLAQEGFSINSIEYGETDSDGEWNGEYWSDYIEVTRQTSEGQSLLRVTVAYDGKTPIFGYSTQNMTSSSPESVQKLDTIFSPLSSSYVTDPTGDADGDGLQNYQELLFFKTDPNKTDSNDDGVTDKQAVEGGIPASLSYANIVVDNQSLGRNQVLSAPADFNLRAIVNVSARVDLGPEGLITPGFTVLGQQKKMLIRAVGPKLADLGVESPLPNPRMTVYRTRFDGNPPDLVATIDDWKADNDNVAEIVSAMGAVGAFPLEPTETFQNRPFMTDDSKSAAALLTLDIGVYTVQVKSADDGIGEVLVEVYEVTD
ncbi:MAG TPA: hypothetical protein DIV79_15940 [Opitutae bacterium]|nr:hypothetical protein [Opitutae bacterium]